MKKIIFKLLFRKLYLNNCQHNFKRNNNNFAIWILHDNFVLILVDPIIN